MRGPRPARRERELLEAVAGVLGTRGYRCYIDPDGSDYFDLAVRRDGEVGLVEGKLSAPSAVLTQALVRRAWADWVAVVVGSRRSAERLVRTTTGRRSACVGVWSCVEGVAEEHRSPVRLSTKGPDDPYVATRDRFRSTLEALDRGELPSAVAWSSVPSTVRDSSRGRRWREWRLDEPLAADR